MYDRLLPWWKRKLLKFQDPNEYRNQKFIKYYSKIKDPVNLDVPEKETYHFKHSGNIGDIIYALPALITLKKNKKSRLYFHIDQPGGYKNMKHPLGNVMLNESVVKKLEPLLLQQPYINELAIYRGENIDFDFDFIRRYPFMHNAGSIPRWYFYFFAINADLGRPWLTVTPSDVYKDYIVVARSFRYRQPLINYRFLSKYPKIVFVGLPDEFEDMKKAIPDITYQPVNNFLELAQIIAGCRLFIGNQSFPFSIAEGLKVKRILEVYIPCPNVIPEGNNGYDFIYQPQFEKLVERIME